MEENQILKKKESILKRIGRALKKAAAVLGLGSSFKMSKDLKENDGVLKRFKGVLKKAAAVFGIVGVLVFAGFAIKGYNDNQQYTSTATIEKTMADLGVENPYLIQGAVTNSYRRLANNGDEPVYVSFDKDFEKESELMEAAVNSLDHLFGIVGDINPSYRYKIVSRAEAEKQDVLGKSVIYYNFGSLSNSTLGKNSMNLDMQDLAYWDLINTSNKITINAKKYLEQKEGFYNNYSDDLAREISTAYAQNLLTHELMHVFGFADVYHVPGPSFIIETFEHFAGLDKIDYNSLNKDTFMDPRNVIAPDLQYLTKKDYASLCALYLPKLSEEQRVREVARLSKKMNEYENMIYQKNFKSIMDTYSGYWGVEKDKVAPMGDISEAEFINSFNYVNYIYKVEVEGDRYTFKLFSDGVLLDSCSGEVVKTDGFFALKDFKLQNGLYPLNEDYLGGDCYAGDVYLFNYEGESRFSLFVDGKNIPNGPMRLYIPAYGYLDCCTQVVHQAEANIE